eukprot:CAMPEP_0176033136 /NCGR_PEP_ID=MMETSP0120_2-20121206/16363_1 /TAXON_ID=160619 /ORGANISM="Kryptoperidinium foliaceum, Strain CCMP 1326" /LENGTH=471 /DNA_ID=CAMNT_0017366459 /DNA_START=144 /DNA_END=1556 /DNA_ORIENTATION=+
MSPISLHSLTLALILSAEVAAFSNPHFGRNVRGVSTSRPSETPLYAVAKKGKTKRKAKRSSRKTKQDTQDVIDAEVIDISQAPNVVVEKPPPLAKNPKGWKGPQVEVPDILNFDLTGGRPGAIIESEEDLARKEQIFQEMEDGLRQYPEWLDEYGFLEEELEAEYDTDDPDAIDASTIGRYDITDLQAKFDHEWDPEVDDDPNIIRDTTGFVQETAKDEEGIEIGYDPMFGPSNPIDTRTKRGVVDSYMIDDRTRDDRMLTPEFPAGDVEVQENEDFVTFRKSLDIIETYTDEFLPPDMAVPRHVATWHGAPEPMKFPPKPYTNNRFTEPENLTNFDAMDPHRARTRAVELARANNAEWLPDGVSQAWHQEQRRPYEEVGTLVGSLRKGEVDPAVVEMIEPALKVLGSCAELLSIEDDTVFRFHYRGLMKNKYGMACWTETLIRDCGVDVTGVVFETGFRARDRQYDGGDP